MGRLSLSTAESRRRAGCSDAAAFRWPSMRVDVKAQAAAPSESIVLTSGVRVTARAVVSGGATLADVSVSQERGQHAWLLGRDAARGGESDCAVGIEAQSFCRVEREPSFYRGF
jgi:hypothetical protein